MNVCGTTNASSINAQERNSCRFCRLQKCLDVGMDPAAVRPDRDFSGQKLLLTRRMTQSAACFSSSSSNSCCSTTHGSAGGDRTSGNNKSGTGGVTNRREKRKGQTGGKAAAAEHCGATAAGRGIAGEDARNCGQRLPVEMRTMLMTLQNIEAKVVRGDTAKNASEIYPLHINTIREVINDPAKLRGRRTAIRYEPYRMARNEELCVIVYRRLIAAIDWVELLAERMGGLSTEDRIALVKACFGPLTLFKCSARTAIVTENENMLCLCNFAYVPREISKAYSDSYHLDNGLVERLLNDLVSPFRRIHLTEEEVVCMSAIIVLNPMARDLSEQAAELCHKLRNRICTTLYQIVKECRAECNPNVWFGNLLLFLPIVASLANAMCENLRFAQTFSSLGGIPLLTSLFGCFPVEPFTAQELAALDSASKEEDRDGESAVGIVAKLQQRKASTEHHGTQTDDGTHCLAILHEQIGRARKRRLGPSDSLTEERVDDFRLFKAPCSYTLTEMFDDLINEEEEMEPQQQQQPVAAVESAMDRKGGEDQMTSAANATGTAATITTPTSSSSSRTENDGETRQVQAVQQQQRHEQQEHQQQRQQYMMLQQCYGQVQPPRTQIQQLRLYDATSTCAGNNTMTSSTTASLGMPGIAQTNLAFTNAQQQPQQQQMAQQQPYGTEMSTMACPNWAPTAYYPDHYQQQYYDAISDHNSQANQFWHQQNRPTVCATSSNRNASQMGWPMPCGQMAPPPPMMMMGNKRRATVSVPTNVMTEFAAQNAMASNGTTNLSNLYLHNYCPPPPLSNGYYYAQYAPPPPAQPNEQQQQ